MGFYLRGPLIGFDMPVEPSGIMTKISKQKTQNSLLYPTYLGSAVLSLLLLIFEFILYCLYCFVFSLKAFQRS
jgi:hypothetical protein